MNNLTETRYTILVVDDNEDILEMIAGDLANTFRVAKALSNKEALNLLEKQPVDLVISDVNLPHVNGFSLCVELKADIAYSHIPFVILTDKSNIESKIESLNYGADAYIEKPISTAHLLAQVNSLIRNRQHVYEHYSQSVLVTRSSITSNKSDHVFLERINRVVVDHLSDPKLCVDLLADKMNMSRPTLYRKIKSISNLSPNELINISRLKKATEYLLNGDLKIYEISTLVGFNSSSHFTRNFQKHFGVSPKDYVHSLEDQHPK